MKKIMKAVTLCSLAFCMLLAIPACGSNKNNGSSETIKTKDATKVVTNADGMQKYVIKLSIDNYLQYFDVTRGYMSATSDVTIIFKGCVYNAIYDDCVVTYEYTTGTDGGVTLTDSFTLNLGGNGNNHSKGRNENIISVTGTVTYWK